MNSSQPTFKDRAFWQLLYRLPQNMISRAAGSMARLRLPPFLMRWVIYRFAQIFKIDMTEVARPIEEFETLQSFFIRRLKDGTRPLDEHSSAFLSPCDGAYGQSGEVLDGELIQVKGKSFRLSELLCDKNWAASLEGGSFATLYLSPRDYHRFHAPCELSISEGIHIPGRLWPVNLWAVQHVDELFCVNERIVMKATSPHVASDPFAIVAVGATMVGKVKLNFDETLTTNLRDGRYLRRSYASNQARFDKAKELGRFEFGSTLVIVMPKNFGTLDRQTPGTPVKMGQKIGTLNVSSK